MIDHFVGEALSVSLIHTAPHTQKIRVARETDPDEFMDFDVNEWNELVTVVHMIDASYKMRRNQIIAGIGITPIGEDDENGS